MANFIVDTNIILEDCEFYNHFDANDHFYLTKSVIRELDKHKSDGGSVGYNARRFAKLLLSEEEDLKRFTIIEGLHGFADDDLLICEKEHTDRTILSNDNYVLLQAKIKGLKARSFSAKKTNPFYSGVTKITLTDDQVQEFCEGGEFRLGYDQVETLNPNEILNLTSSNGHYVGNVLFKSKNLPVKRFPEKKPEVLGITPRNQEQEWLIHLGQLLFNPMKDKSIDLLTVEGVAGSGKTLLSVAMALKALKMEGSVYKQITLTKPVASMGNQEVGFLKGSYKDKIMPFMNSYLDILNKLGYGNAYAVGGDESNTQEGFSVGKGGKIEVSAPPPIIFDALTFIRGRNLSDIIICDEAQNLSRGELKTLLTRADEGAKIILIGDTDQIDVPFLNKHTNGFSFVIDTLKHLSFTGHIKMVKSERSRLAEACGTLL